LKYDAPEKQLQFHTRTPPAMGRRSAMFHGHGGGIDESKEDLRRSHIRAETTVGMTQGIRIRARNHSLPGDEIFSSLCLLTTQLFASEGIKFPVIEKNRQKEGQNSHIFCPLYMNIHTRFLKR